MLLPITVFPEPQIAFGSNSAVSDDPSAFDALGMMFDESWQPFARVSVSWAFPHHFLILEQ